MQADELDDLNPEDPTDLNAKTTKTTLTWDEIEARIIEGLHKMTGGGLAAIHNRVCSDDPVVYIGDSMFNRK